MKKILFCTAIISLLLTSSCSRDNTPVEPVIPPSELPKMLIHAASGDTRTTLENNGYTVSWNTQDKLHVYMNSLCKVYRATAAEGKTATFEGDHSWETGQEYLIESAYVGSVPDVIIALGEVSIPNPMLDIQTQTGLSSDHIGVTNIMVAKPVTLTAAGDNAEVSLVFAHAYPILEFRLTVDSGDDITINKIVMTSKQAPLAGRNIIIGAGEDNYGEVIGIGTESYTTELRITGNPAIPVKGADTWDPVGGGSKYDPVTPTDGSIFAARMLILPGNHAGANNFTFDIHTNKGIYTYQSNGAVFEGGIRYVTGKVIPATEISMNMVGSGTQPDPYIVFNAADMASTMAMSGVYINLGGNIDLTGWSTLPAFNGVLMGGGYALTGLTVPLINTLSGTVQDVKLSNVNMSTSTLAEFGALARTASAAIVKGVSVTGSLSVTTLTGDQAFGGLIGLVSQGSTVSNCYTNVTMTSTVSCVGGLIGRIGTTTQQTIIEFCTTEGALSPQGTAGKVGGILGRKVSGGSGTDIIRNCLSSMMINNTNTGSNMYGGIFGALQPDLGLTIRQCMFTGRANSGSAAGGIGGVSPVIEDCIVFGRGYADTGGTSSIVNSPGNTTGGGGGIASAAKGNILRSIVINSRITGVNCGGIVSTRNAGTPNISGCVLINSSLPATGRLVAFNAASLTLSGNYYYAPYYSDETPFVVSDPSATGWDGAEIVALTQGFFEGLGYDFTSVWIWDTINNAPKLRKVGCDESVK